MSDLISAVAAPVRVQAAHDGALFDSRYDYLAWQDFVIGQQSTSTGFRIDMLTEPDMMMCFIPMAGTTHIETHDEVVTSADSTIHVMSGRAIRRFNVSPLRQQISLMISTPALEQHLGRATGRNVKLVGDATLTVDRNTALGSAMANFGAIIVESMKHTPVFDVSDIAMRRCRDGFIDLTIGALGTTQIQQLTQRDGLLTLRYVREAEDFMRHNCHLPIGVTEVAEHVGVSVRSLQYAFQRHRGRTPVQALIGFRLAAARDDIVHSPDIPLADIAMAWGFLHMGRFASLFRQTFGEAPRDLRKRTRHGRWPSATGVRTGATA
ncbi:helix-turn-helix domain-containing protein [uncultured Alsobacter sp.]|uniref:AraC family transcriptional regulator n=1 Tax=uncultured Alsobacter sp. TaxID=1748258 RepID=UPI0025E2D36C|nr:helix-turn-helix domain-containing protein [uncultured Alsobacter sp.]